MKRVRLLVITAALFLCAAAVLRPGSTNRAKTWADPGTVNVKAKDHSGVLTVARPDLAWLKQINRNPVIPRPDKVRGIYLTAATVNSDRITELIGLVRETELNSVVIDLKDDKGKLAYKNNAATGAGNQHFDPAELIRTLAAHGVYPIARVVAFKDSHMARQRPDLAVQKVSGGLWLDAGGNAWLDPYNRDVWDYLVEVAREASRLGFREIQFDYVRFPSDGNIKLALYPARQKDMTKVQAITAFLEYAKAELRDGFDGEISADVFGLVTSSRGDMGIGQVWEEIAANVDVICPMLYPSHYRPGNLGVRDPEEEPYATVYRSLEDGRRRLSAAGLETTVIRPWLQFFSLRIKYGPAEVSAQVRAAKELGIEEYLLWNAASTYPRSFFPLDQ